MFECDGNESYGYHWVIFVLFFAYAFCLDFPSTSLLTLYALLNVLSAGCYWLRQDYIFDILRGTATILKWFV